MSHLPPKFDRTYYEHMTTDFGVNELPVDLGEVYTLEIIGEASDSKGQACVVGNYKRWDGKQAHITLSLAEGVKPVYSNELLKGGWNKIPMIEVTGRVSSFTDKGWYHG